MEHENSETVEVIDNVQYIDNDEIEEAEYLDEEEYQQRLMQLQQHEQHQHDGQQQQHEDQQPQLDDNGEPFSWYSPHNNDTASMRQRYYRRQKPRRFRHSAVYAEIWQRRQSLDTDLLMTEVCKHLRGNQSLAMAAARLGLTDKSDYNWLRKISLRVREETDDWMLGDPDDEHDEDFYPVAEDTRDSRIKYTARFREPENLEVVAMVECGMMSYPDGVLAMGIPEAYSNKAISCLRKFIQKLREFDPALRMPHYYSDIGDPEEVMISPQPSTSTIRAQTMAGNSLITMPPKKKNKRRKTTTRKQVGGESLREAEIAQAVSTLEQDSSASFSSSAKHARIGEPSLEFKPERQQFRSSSGRLTTKFDLSSTLGVNTASSLAASSYEPSQQTHSVELEELSEQEEESTLISHKYEDPDPATITQVTDAEVSGTMTPVDVDDQHRHEELEDYAQQQEEQQQYEQVQQQQQYEQVQQQQQQYVQEEQLQNEIIKQ